MENLTYVKDSRNNREAAQIDGVARFQMGGIGVLSRSDLEDGIWSDYRPIAKSVASRTEFYEHMIGVAQHAAATGQVIDLISGTRALLGPGVTLHIGAEDGLGCGYQLSPEQNERIPEEARSASGWYAMPGMGSLVTAFLPELFPERSVEIAREAVAEEFPDLSALLEGAAAPRR